MTSLQGADGSQLVFLGTLGALREDGETNLHRMFRVIHDAPYFEEVEDGPWLRLSRASFVRVADLNNDGLDDLIVGNENQLAFIFTPDPDGSWTDVPLTGGKARNWRNAMSCRHHKGRHPGSNRHSGIPPQHETRIICSSCL